MNRRCLTPMSALLLVCATACASSQDATPPVTPGVATPPKATAAASTPMKLASKGYIGTLKFAVDCTPEAGGAVTVLPDATTLRCKDASAGVEITVRIVDGKVGTMDASPNKGASLITLNAGAHGYCDNTDGRCNTGLWISQWDPQPGYHVGHFGMNWHDSDKPPRLEGQLEGTFSF